MAWAKSVLIACSMGDNKRKRVEAIRDVNQAQCDALDKFKAIKDSLKTKYKESCIQLPPAPTP